MNALIGATYSAAAAVSLAIALAAWRRRPAPGALPLAILCAAQAGWSTVFALQWTLSDHEPSLVWLLLRLALLQITPTAILAFVLDFGGWRRWLTPGTVGLLSIQPVVTILIAATDPWHGLYLAGEAPGLMVTSGGPVFTINAIYSYALLLVAAGLLISRLGRTRPYRSQTATALLAVMLPAVQFLLQLAGVSLSERVNTVPFAYTVSGAVLWFAIARLGLFRVLPVARDQLIEQLPDGLIVFDAGRSIVDINPAAVRLTGAQLPCIGKSADEAFPAHAEAIASLRAGLLHSDHTTVRTPTIEGGTMEAVATSVAGRDGQRIATLVTLRDISDQISMTEELATRSEQLAAALERSDRILTAMTDGVLLLDTEARVIRDNPAARMILRGAVNSLEGLSVTDLLPGLEGSMSDAIRHDRQTSLTSLALPDGRPIGVTIIPLVESVPEGARALAVVRDETERLAAERMLRDFVANVSHEVQTPLTGLSLLAATIKRAAHDDPASVEGFIDRLGSETTRLTQLTRGLMMLSRAESPATSQLFTVVDLSRIVTEECTDLEPLAAQKDQSLSLTVEPEIVLMGDEAGLRAIVANTLGNAIRYTQERGTLAVRLTVQCDAHGARQAVIVVSDDGPGIPAESQTRVFERFYRIDQARSSRTGGSGLGLSIVRHAAEQHGGTATVQSEPGKGSRFIITLPLDTPAIPSATGQPHIT